MLVPYPYQERGRDFLLTPDPAMGMKPHRYLGDDMGLGKTVQAILAIKRLRPKTVLIVCPATVKYNWFRKFIEWEAFNESDMFIVTTGADIIPDRRVIIINYDLCIKKAIHDQLSKRRFTVVVFDEAHRLRNATTKRTRCLLSTEGLAKNCVWKFLLSGTPIPNQVIDIYWVLSTLAPELLGKYDTYDKFGYRYCGGIREDDGTFKGGSNLDELKARLKPFLLRRELQDVIKELPPVIENVIDVEVNLRDHPEVAEDQHEGHFELATLRRIIAELKVDVALQYITDIMYNTDCKLTVFAYHKNVVRRLKEGLSDFNPVVVAGGSTAKQKDESVQKFKLDPECRIIIGQIIASGEGVDGLQEVCSEAVFAEIDWSPGAMSQARSRLQRIGQKHPVKVTYLVAANTIEAVMAAVLKRKKARIDNVIQSTHEETHMTIEAKLDRIIELLEGLATGAPAAAAEPTEEKPKTKGKSKGKGKTKKEEPKVTFDDVKDAGSAFLDTPGASEDDDVTKQAKAIIKKFGGKKLADLKETPEVWEDVIKAFNAGPVLSGSSDDEDDDEDEDDDI